MIIHISGPSGSGKTFLGNQLKKKFGNKIIVKDLDDLRKKEFFPLMEKSSISFTNFRDNFSHNYQLFIDDFIDKHKSKIIIFTGLNVMSNHQYYFRKHIKKFEAYYPNTFFKLHASYKFYIKLKTNIIIRQRWDREYNDFMKGFYDYVMREKENIYKQVIKNEQLAKNDICEYITDIIDFSGIRSHVNHMDKLYANKKYIILSRDKILSKCIQLIDEE